MPLAFVATAQFTARAEDWPEVFNPFKVETLYFELDAATWDDIKHDTNYYDPVLNIRVPCLMWAAGETNKLLVQIRRKSDPALPNETTPQKVSLKIDINEYVSGQEWRGLKKLSLENGAGGNGVLREGLAMNLNRLASDYGIYPYQAGYSAWVRVFVNSNLVGVYSSPEQRDKNFLKHRGMYKPGASWLYEINAGIFLDTTVASTNSPTHDHLCYTPFRTACSQPNLESDLPQWIDMQGMFALAAVEAFSANNDGLFTHNGKNSFCADFLPSTQLKRLYFPWDLDAVLNVETWDIYTGGPGNPSSHVYQRQILDHYWFRQVYRHTMTDLLDGPLSTAVVTDFLNQLEPVLGPYLAEDPNAGESFAAVRQYFTNRVANVRTQVGTITGWPLFSQSGGEIIPGFQLTLTHTNAAGTIYYTLNGTDPRGLGGITNGLAYSGPLTLTNTVHIAARVKSGTNWSALRQQTFNIAGHGSALKVTEIMYAPKAPSTNEDAGDYEFIELQNTGATPINLSGCSFEGIDFKFAPGTIVSPGSFVLLVRNPVTFASRYPGVSFHGVYFGGLSATGEKIRLRNSEGNNLLSVEYDDKPPWPLGAATFGHSLVNLNPGGDPDRPENWRASTAMYGSPGTNDPAPSYGLGVVVNEVISHTDTPLEDAIELYNASTNAIDISGWFLSDENNTADPARARLKKYRFPAGTIIPGGGYKVLYENDFNPVTTNSTALIKFSLSQFGEGAYLSSADGSGNLTGCIVGLEFGASDNGVSFGRYSTSVGTDFTFLSQHTFGVANPATKADFRLGTGLTNSGPRVGPVVINEIMYNPSAGGTEFVELLNIAGTNVDLGGWTLSGAGFVFPSNTLIAPSNFLVLIGSTNITAAQFRSSNQVPVSVPILSYSFDLKNEGEALELFKPNETNTPILMERVRYNDKSPWPTEADGEGPSLERFSSPAYGNDPANWRTAKNGGTPGAAGIFTNIFAIVTNSSWRYQAKSYNLGTPWEAASYSDSGWLENDGALGFGQPDINTILTNAPGVTNRPVTTYFRKEFVISDAPASINRFVMRANYDDGFVAYINGQEVARRSMGVETVSNSTLALDHAAGTYETIDLLAHTNKLVKGGNVLAIEVHQATTNDTDLVWDADLVYSFGVLFTQPNITFVHLETGTGLLIQWASDTGAQYYVQRSSNLWSWTDINPSITASGSATQYIDTNAPSGASSRYYRIRRGE